MSFTGLDRGNCESVGPSLPGRHTFDCTFSNELVSVTCLFDRGAVENCSLPLIVDFSRFGTDHHNVVLAATDVFGQTARYALSFNIFGGSPPHRILSLIFTKHSV